MRLGKTTSIAWALALLLCCLSLLGCGQGNGKETNRERGAAQNLVAVEALVVQPQLLQNKINTTGTLLANEEIELRSEISGRVTGVFFQEGQQVAKGALLLKINDRELQAQLESKQVEEKQATDELNRQRKLFEINAISQEDLDKAQNALRMIQSEKEVIQAQISETEIKAPFNGVVGLRHISEGGYVTSDLVIADLQDVDQMKVEFSVPEKYAEKLSNGTRIAVNAGESDRNHDGVVYAIEAKIDQETRTIKARARVPNPEHDLVPGAFAKIEITLEELPNAIVIPSGAVIPEIDGEKVFVCTNGKAKAVAIKTGIRTERGVQVTQGLAVADTLITSGLLQLADGKGVRIQSLQQD